MSRNAVAENANVPASTRNAVPTPASADQDTADRRPDEPDAERANELAERVRLEKELARDDVADDAGERGREDRAARAVDRDERDHVPELQRPAHGQDRRWQR